MRILVSVFSNLFTDQRVEKVCRTLHEKGYEVELIGNDWGGAPPLHRPYPVERIALKSKTLKTAYPEFNYKLAQILKKKAGGKTVLLSNDLDTLAANYLVSRQKRIPLVFDSHEIYTEMPALQGRFTQKVWRWLEKKLLPEVQYMITASESYAFWFQQKYGISKPVVIQNFPFRQQIVPNREAGSTKIIMYQGAINPSRGLDKIIPAMALIPDAHLWIAGAGPKLVEYQQFSKTLGLAERIKFLGSASPHELRGITLKADVGLSIEENNGESYYYSLPNKVSDYIQARIPVVVSDFPEMKKIVNSYQVGVTIDHHAPEELSRKIRMVLNKGKDFYKEHLEVAAKHLCWENEALKLLQLFDKVRTENFKQ